MGEVRDFQADRQKAIKETLAAVKSAGGDTSHLESLLKAGPQEFVALDVPQPMEPGTATPGVPLSPLPVGQPEPNDGSAPDKRKQDNSPVVEEGIVVGPKDPGPEAKVSELPDAVPPAEPAKAPKAGALPDQTSGPDDPVEGKTPEELDKEAKAKDRARDKAEAEPPSAKIDANKAAPILPQTAKEAPAKKAAPAKTVPAKKA